MKNIEEQADSTVLLDDQAVSDYLRQNPDFFIRNARQIEQMAVPHPVRGSVSLVEWHMARQRNHIQQLEEEITLLMEQATANHELFDRLLALQSHLAAADSLQSFLAGADEHPGSWWTDWLSWLELIDGTRVKAVGKRKPGGRGDPVIEDAPGRYVAMR